MTFKIGQKVICIASFLNRSEKECIPIKGSIYTIRGIILDVSEKETVACLLFEELINPVLKYAEGLMEVHFPSKYFRPLVEEKYDLTVFRNMLNPINEKV